MRSWHIHEPEHGMQQIVRLGGNCTWGVCQYVQLQRNASTTMQILHLKISIEHKQNGRKCKMKKGEEWEVKRSALFLYCAYAQLHTLVLFPNGGLAPKAGVLYSSSGGSFAQINRTGTCTGTVLSTVNRWHHHVKCLRLMLPIKSRKKSRTLLFFTLLANSKQLDVSALKWWLSFEMLMAIMTTNQWLS